VTERQRTQDRQDLCKPKKGGRDPQQNLEGGTEPPGRRALPDPQRRLATIRRGWAGRRDLLCQGRARRATRAAHALAYLHPAWHVAAVDRLEPRRSRRRS